MPEDQNQLFLMLGRLEGKVDAVLSKTDGYEKRLEDFEDRLLDIEKSKATSEGIFSSAKTMWIAVAAILGSFADDIFRWITR